MLNRRHFLGSAAAGATLLFAPSIALSIVLAFLLPIVMIILVTGFVVLSFFLLPKIFRLVRGSIPIMARLCKMLAGSMKRPRNFPLRYVLIPVLQSLTLVWPPF